MIDFQGPRCETCRFYLAEDKLCRRSPPQLLAWLDPKPKNPKEPVVIRTQFPIMLPSGWCGEHKEL